MEPPAPDPAAPPTAPAPAPEPAPPLAERAVLPQAPRLNPWIAIWVRPRATMRQILEADPRRFVHRLVAIGWTAGMAQGLVLSDWGDAVPAVFLPGVFVLTAALGTALGLILLYLNGFLLRLTGRWLEGQGDAVSIRVAARRLPEVSRGGAPLLGLARSLGGRPGGPDPPGPVRDPRPDLGRS